jgi:flagellar biosynthetic protein FliR
MTALLLANLVLGFVSRTVPQLNIQAVGFGLNSLATLGMLAASLGAIAWLFQEHVDPALDEVLSAFSRAVSPGQAPP